MFVNNYTFFSPNILHVKEFEAFDQIFDIYNDNLYPYVYHDFLVDNAKYIIKHVKINGLVFRLTGTITNAFERQVTYVGSNHMPATATSLSTVPADYIALTGYTSPAEDQIVIDCSIRLRHHTNYTDFHVYPFKIIVDNNYELFNTQFKAALKGPTSW